MNKTLKKILMSLTLIAPIAIATPILLTSCSNQAVDKGNNSGSGNNQPEKPNPEPEKPNPEPEKPNPEPEKPDNSPSKTELFIPNNYDSQYGKLFNESVFAGKKLSDINLNLIKESVVDLQKVEIPNNSTLFKDENTNSFTFNYKFKERPEFSGFEQTIYLGFEQENKSSMTLNDFSNFFKKDDGTFNTSLYYEIFMSSEGLYETPPFPQSALNVKNLLKNIMGIEDFKLFYNNGFSKHYPNFDTNKITLNKGDGLIYKYDVSSKDRMHPVSVEISNNVDIYSFEVKQQKYFEVKVPKNSVTLKWTNNDKIQKEYKNNYDFWFYLKDLKK